jgi:hypothetical protein
LTGADAAGTASSLLDSFPTLHLPAGIVVPSDPDQDSAVVVFEVTASDDQAGVSLVTLPRSGSTFPIGITTVFATAVDTAGHLVRAASLLP